VSKLENKQYNFYSPTILRFFLGLLFVIPGFQKLMNPSMITGMLEGLGFPAPTMMAWILLLSEIVFGMAILTGFRLNYSVWPLVFILLVAIITVHIPAWLQAKPMALIGLILHFLGMASLVSIYLTGPGAYSIDRVQFVFTDSSTKIKKAVVEKPTIQNEIQLTPNKIIEPEQSQS